MGMVGLFLAAILGHPVAFFLLLFTIAVLGLREFYLLPLPDGLFPQKTAGIFAGAAFLLISYLHARGLINSSGYLAMIPAALLLFIMEIYRNSQQPYPNIAYTFMGLLYIAVPLGCIFYVAFPGTPNPTYQPLLVIGFFILLWLQDTGAYISGSLWGKNPLFKRISPTKSIEGLVGGIILVAGASFVLSRFFHVLSPAAWVVSGLLISVFSTFGDLAESMLKRSAGIKDSGNILPGHGGILDRFDGVFFAAPMYYFFLRLIM